MINILTLGAPPLYKIGIENYLKQYINCRFYGKELEDKKEESDLDKIKLLKPDLVIFCRSTTDLSTLQSVTSILRNNESLKIIVLLNFENDQIIMELLKSGVKAILNKYTAPQYLLEAINKVSSNEEYYCKEAVEIIITRFSKGNPEVKSLLTPTEFNKKEIDIIKMICLQKTSKEISTDLQINVKTIDYYRQKIMEKVMAKNTVGILVYALKNKLITLNEL